MNIVNGMGDGSFNANSNITREQAATILFSIATFLNCDIPSITTSPYVDSDKIASWAIMPVQGMYAMNIMKGNDVGYFLPNDIYTS